MLLRAARGTIATVAIALAITVLLAWATPLRFAYRSQSLHVAIETAAALAAALTALLVLGRFRDQGRAADVLLAWSLLCLACANTMLSAAPIIAGHDVQPPFVMWLAVFVSLAGAAGFALSAALDTRQIVRRARALYVGAGGLALVIAVSAGVSARFATRLGSASGTPPELSARPHLSGPIALVSVQMLAAGLFLFAAACFTRKAARRGDRFVGLFGIACVLAAFARINYVLFPSLFTEVVYSGDLFRLASYLTLLVAASVEIMAYWRFRAEAATLEERQRLAREYHDGLAQELAYIATEARSLEGRSPELASLASAAERALGEARRAIRALSVSDDEPFSSALERIVRESPWQAGIATRLERLSVEPPKEIREDLLRIAQEAVANAARHAKAGAIAVELSDPPLRLRVIDDGIGFVPRDVAGGDHFGISSMEARALRIGASLSFTSRPTGGTVVEVALR
jgi:signal transduction histidine kinase